MRTAAHLIALDRGVTTLFVFLTIFPRPLRLYIDTPHAPLVDADEVRPLEPAERAEVEAFVRSYIDRDRPTLAAPEGDDYPGEAPRLRAPRCGSRDSRARQRVPQAVALRDQRRKAARPSSDFVTPSRAVARPAVRVLPAPRDRRLQGQARHPSLRRPGIHRRDDRRHASARPRSCTQGASGRHRPQPSQVSAQAHAARARASRGPAHVIARADPPITRRRS